jgi:hypothetical protein
MTSPLEIDRELPDSAPAGRAAYNAFLQELRAYLPHEASGWDELPMPLKQAWSAAAAAAQKLAHHGDTEARS